MDIKGIDIAKNGLQIANKTNLETDKFSKTFENAVENNDKKEMKKACESFEMYFLNMMFKSMRKTVVSGGGLFEKSNGEKLFQEMLDEQMCNNMAKAGGIGIADMMYKRISSNMDYKI